MCAMYNGDTEIVKLLLEQPTEDLGDQTTWKANKIQEAERGRKLNIQIQLD